MDGSGTERHRADVLVSCLHGRCAELVPALEEEIKRRGLADEVDVVEAGCRGLCAMGPVLLIQPEGLFYTDVKPADVPELVEETLIKGRVVDRLVYKEPQTHQAVCRYEDIPFYTKQVRHVMRRCGMINPQSIDEYIALGGYEALSKVLVSMTPEDVIEEVKRSGLRGRGGAGFSTGRKWESTRNAKGEARYVIANGDEGDPGAFMNRSLMEGDPHAIIEGMIIGAYAIGAQQGYIYVRDEYPLAVNNLQIALERACEYGLLGEDILGSGFNFDIKIVRGAGAFVCGESSALMQSVEGKVGEPRPKHYHATERGLWDQPTALNNVETWANIPLIINNGAEWFASVGSGGSKGTKTFCLVGQIENTGLIEVPLGIPLREIIYDIGGGIPGGRQFKAVQTGGPSGGCIPAELLDLQVDYDSLVDAGSMMGSGGMIVMDDHTCMVDIARYFLDFLKEESCGKCSPCREGIRGMLDIVTRITEGKGQMSDLDTLEGLARVVQSASLCGLGKSAPNPVLSTLRYFRDEYEAHILEHRCPAGVCKALIHYEINPENCTGCGLCRRKCPREAISGERKEPHVIDQTLCIKCGVCHDVCRFDAVDVR
ncbi:MAG: NADH-quinone oxidoreductase subunit NuoF [Anaerolineales bacterium]|nr:NADH-quinone oxidoreductase subunit NuoF [Anaerolineales bacterium]